MKPAGSSHFEGTLFRRHDSPTNACYSADMEWTNPDPYIVLRMDKHHRFSRSLGCFTPGLDKPIYSRELHQGLSLPLQGQRRTLAWRITHRVLGSKGITHHVTRRPSQGS